MNMSSTFSTLQAAQQGNRLPVIALRADAYEENRDQCLAVGMDDFLNKPISVTALSLTLGKRDRQMLDPQHFWRSCQPGLV